MLLVLITGASQTIPCRAFAGSGQRVDVVDQRQPNLHVLRESIHLALRFEETTVRSKCFFGRSTSGQDLEGILTGRVSVRPITGIVIMEGGLSIVEIVASSEEPHEALFIGQIGRLYACGQGGVFVSREGRLRTRPVLEAAAVAVIAVTCRIAVVVRILPGSGF
jgi:hypothetical protein